MAHVRRPRYHRLFFASEWKEAQDAKNTHSITAASIFHISQNSNYYRRSRTPAHSLTRTNTRAHTHAHTHTHMHTHTHTRADTHTPIHTQSHVHENTDTHTRAHIVTYTKTNTHAACVHVCKVPFRPNGRFYGRIIGSKRQKLSVKSPLAMSTRPKF